MSVNYSIYGVVSVKLKNFDTIKFIFTKIKEFSKFQTKGYLLALLCLILFIMNIIQNNFSFTLIQYV